MSAARDPSALVAELAEVDDPTRVLVERTLEAIGDQDSALVETVRLCAIPRLITSPVVGVLRNAPSDEAGNRHVLDVLAEHELLTSKHDGSFALNDGVRERLLHEWRSDEGEKRATFDSVSQRLVQYYVGQHDAALRLDSDLVTVASMMRVARADRYARLSATVESMLRDPLLDAFYHETLRSPAAGYALFERVYALHEQSMRFTICAALVGAAQLDFARLYPESETASYLRWFRYWEARLLRSVNRFEEAEVKLRALASDPVDDPKLRLWISGELGAALQQQFKLRDALQAYLNDSAAADATQVDPWNIAVSYLRLGSLYSTLGELSNAVHAFETAVSRAEDVSNETARAQALLQLADTLIIRGDRDAAFEPALRGFDIARTTSRGNRDLQVSVAASFMNLLSPLDPGLLDTTWREAREIAATMGEQLAQLGVDKQYVDRLRDGARLPRATLVLANLNERAAAVGDPTFECEVLLTEALVQEQQGQLREAIATYDRIDGEGVTAPTAWVRAAALSNRGHNRSELGAWEESRIDLETAWEAWDRIGNESLSALMHAWMAQLECRRGDLDHAHAALDDVAPTLMEFGSRFVGDCLEIRSEILAGQGRWAEAAEQRALAVDRAKALGDVRTQGLSLSRLAEMTGRRGDWEASARWSRLAAAHSRVLADRAVYRSSEQVDSADCENARAALRFFQIGDERHEGAVNARDHLRSAAQRTPGNFWYRLNLAYVCAALQEWAEAADAFDAALAHGPAALAAPIVCERLAECRLRQASDLEREEAYEDAIKLLDAVQRRLEGKISDEWLSGFARLIGDIRVKQLRLGDARALYESGDAFLNLGAPMRASYQLRFGLLAALEGHSDVAVEHFRHGLDIAAEGPDSFWSVVELCTQLKGPGAAPQALDDALRTVLSGPEIGGQMTRFTPRLSLPLPDGWRAREEITLVAPDGQANIVASSESVSADLTTREYAEAAGTTLASNQLPGFQEISFEPSELSDGREGWLRRFTWDPPDAPNVTQSQLYYVEGERGYTATATSVAGEAARYDLQLSQLLSGLLVRT